MTERSPRDIQGAIHPADNTTPKTKDREDLSNNEYSTELARLYGVMVFLQMFFYSLQTKQLNLDSLLPLAPGVLDSLIVSLSAVLSAAQRRLT